MPSMRVFELAKELNMPARQMIQKLRSAGVPVSGNFHELTEDQVSRVRNLISGKQSVGDAGLRSRADGTRRVISSRRSAEEPQDTEEEPRVITISAKTQQDQAEEDDNRPRRRRRRKLEEDLEVEAETLTEDSQEQTQTAEKVEDEQKEEKTTAPSEPEPVAEKPEPEVDKETEPVTPKTAQKKVAPVEEARPVTRPDRIRTKAPAQALQKKVRSLLKEGLSSERAPVRKMFWIITPPQKCVVPESANQTVPRTEKVIRVWLKVRKKPNMFLTRGRRKSK